jgi:hypothetical protein
MKPIPLKGKYGEGKFTKVSDQDFDFVRGLSLYVNDGYVKTYHKGRHWRLHQLLVGSHYDHINQDKLDNTRENLRPCTQRQNNANVQTRGESGYKNVSRDKTTKNSWKASISVDGKMVHLGNFENPHFAALAVDLWLVDIHGEFARTNFPIVSSSLG